LVELVVVVFIIAILAAALTATINPSNMMKKSRDARRISDLNSVNKAMMAALSEGKILSPGADLAVRSSCDNRMDVTDVNGVGWVGGWTGYIGDYISVLPKDPLNTGFYCYYFAMSASGSWELATVIESYENANMAIYDGGSSGTSLTCSSALMPNSNCRYEVGTDVNVIP